MGQLTQRLASCERALTTLEQILQEPFSVIVRDAAIQRFEYSFESLWKAVRVYLREQEGVVCDTPKQCFRSAVAAGLLSVTEGEECLRLTDDRNLTAHTYVEGIARRIYGRLPDYAGVMRVLLEAMKAKAGNAGSNGQEA